MAELRLDKANTDHSSGMDMNLFTFGSNNFGSIFSETGNYNQTENQQSVCNSF